MASRVLVEAEPIFDSPTVRLTAVAVSVREEHTIAFLGDSQGNLHKVLQSFQGICVFPIFSNNFILYNSSIYSLFFAEAEVFQKMMLDLHLAGYFGGFLGFQNNKKLMKI